jgi:hypothetical protein
MASEWLYAVPNPSANMVQVYLADRERKFAYQLVNYRGQYYRLKLNYGLPSATRRMVSPGGVPPVTLSRRSMLDPRPPSGPCLHCGRKTTPDGVSNAFWAEEHYRPAGFICPDCGQPTIYL